MSTEQAIQEFCAENKIKDVSGFTELLKLSDIAIKNGLYISTLSKERLYFRRTRVPTLLWLTWDKALLSPAIVYLLRILTPHSKTAHTDINTALQATAEMITIAKNIGLAARLVRSIEFEHATLTLFAELRRYIFTSLTETDIRRINTVATTYMKTYPQHYTIPKLTLIKKRVQIPRRLLGLFLRETTIYRKRDRFILATSMIQRRLIYRYLRRSKSHLADQSMGVETLMR
jgi:hypothetical protein